MDVPFSDPDLYKYILRSRDKTSGTTNSFTVQFPYQIAQNVQELWLKLEAVSIPKGTTNPRQTWIEIRLKNMSLPTTVSTGYNPPFAVIPYSNGTTIRMYLPQPWTKIGANNLGTLSVELVDDTGAPYVPAEWVMVFQVAVKRPDFLKK